MRESYVIRNSHLICKTVNYHYKSNPCLSIGIVAFKAFFMTIKRVLKNKKAFIESKERMYKKYFQ